MILQASIIHDSTESEAVRTQNARSNAVEEGLLA